MSDIDSMKASMGFNLDIRKALFEIQLMKPRIKTISNYFNAITSMNLKMIIAINQKFSRTPDKAKKLTLILMRSFGNTVKKYLDAIDPVLRKFLEIIQILEKKEYDDLKFIDQAIRYWLDIENRRPAYFSQDVIKNLQRSFDEFASLIKKHIRDDVDDDDRLAKGREPFVGFFTRIRSEAAIWDAFNRNVIKSGIGLMSTQKMKDEMWRQLNTGAELTLPYMFSRFLKEEGKFEILVHQAHQDVVEEIYKLLRNHSKVGDKTRSLSLMFSNYQEWSEFSEVVRKSQDVEGNAKKLREFVQKQKEDELTIFRSLRTDEDAFKLLIGRLEQHRQSAEAQGATRN
jgi:hypothetical protein